MKHVVFFLAIVLAVVGCRRTDVRDFTIPLCANVHMVGSALKMLTSMVAITIIYGFKPEFGKMVNFIFMMGIAAVAAPGVMSGVLMASVGLMSLTPIWMSDPRPDTSSQSRVSSFGR